MPAGVTQVLLEDGSQTSSRCSRSPQCDSKQNPEHESQCFGAGCEPSEGQSDTPLQLDESTDVVSCSQLIVFVRCLRRTDLKEEYLFSEPLTTITRGADMFKVLETFVANHELD